MKYFAAGKSWRAKMAGERFGVVEFYSGIGGMHFAINGIIYLSFVVTNFIDNSYYRFCASENS